MSKIQSESKSKSYHLTGLFYACRAYIIVAKQHTRPPQPRSGCIPNSGIKNSIKELKQKLLTKFYIEFP